MPQQRCETDHPTPSLLLPRLHAVESVSMVRVSIPSRAKARAARVRRVVNARPRPEYAGVPFRLETPKGSDVDDSATSGRVADESLEPSATCLHERSSRPRPGL
jgi:hypothetical protein